MSDTKYVSSKDLRVGPGKDGGMSFREVCNAVGEQLERDFQTKEGRERAAEEKHLYAAPDEYWLLVRNMTKWRQVGGRRYPEPCVEVETIEEFPMGIGRLKATGKDYAQACVELRFLYACKLNEHKLLESSQECRDYAHRAVFRASLEG